MTKFPLLAALAILPLAAAAPLAVPATAQTAPTGDLARVQTHLTAMQTLRADFRQTDRNGQALTGVLTIKAPGKIRFQYQQGIPLLIVADGRSLNVIDYEVRQVQRWPIRNSPLAVLIDPTANLMRYARLRDSDDANTISVEVRDPRRPEYGTITMVFQRDAAGPGGLRLHGWVAIDAQDHRTSIRLSNQRYNQPVADSTFRWRDPRPNTRSR
jgi:outer membrane lipoprotein-sorting protein